MNSTLEDFIIAISLFSLYSQRLGEFQRCKYCLVSVLVCSWAFLGDGWGKPSSDQFLCTEVPSSQLHIKGNNYLYCSEINICLATVSYGHVLPSLLDLAIFCINENWQAWSSSSCLLLNALLYLQFTQNNLWQRFAFIRTAVGFIPYLKVLLDVTIK